MKKRLLTLAMAGVMVTAAMAPVAMAANTGNATVTYVAGAGTPDGSDGSYYVVFPADLTFFTEDDTPSHTVELKATSGVASDLNQNLVVKVDVTGTGLLSNASYDANDISYEVDYNGSKVNEGTTTASFNLTPAASSVTGNAAIKETTLPNVAKGTAFTDTLTFKLTQTAPTV